LFVGSCLCVALRVVLAQAHTNDGECPIAKWLWFGNGFVAGCGNLLQFVLWTLWLFLASALFLLPAGALVGALGVDVLSPETPALMRVTFGAAMGLAAPEVVGRLAEQLRKLRWASSFAETIDLRLRKWLRVHIDRRTAEALSRLRSGADQYAIDRLYECNLAEIMLRSLRCPRSKARNEDVFASLRGVAKTRQIDLKFRRLCITIGMPRLERELARIQDLRVLSTNGQPARGLPLPTWPVAANPRGTFDERRAKPNANGPRTALRWWEDDEQLRALHDEAIRRDPSA
jgi:hypothetical protein